MADRLLSGELSANLQVFVPVTLVSASSADLPRASAGTKALTDLANSASYLSCWLQTEPAFAPAQGIRLLPLLNPFSG